MSPSVFSQWTNNTSVNTAICDTTGDQATPKVASTSDGGCYIMWFDNRLPNYKVYLQRLDAAGRKMWANQGLLISAFAQNTSLQDFNIDVDASDNAVIVFTDLRNGPVLNPSAYLIAPDGTFLWGPNGVSLTDTTTISQNIPVCCATSDGNYFFAWSYSSSPTRIAMQKLNAAGVPQFSTLIKIRGTGTENSNNMRMVKSDNGSVIMIWQNYIGNIVTTSSIKIFTQKFSSTGAIQWSNPQDTIQNLGRVAGISFIPYLASDGNDGAVMCWVDDRDANARQSAWTQRINSAGVIQFPKNGSEGSTLSSNNHFLPTVTFVKPTGETVMFWTETNGGQTVVGGLNGQKFDATGNAQWGSSGKTFKNMDNNQLSFLSAFAYDTNVVVSYTESMNGSAFAHVLALRTGPSSVPHWTGDTIEASSSSTSKIRKQASMNKLTGNTVMAWSNGDIIAQNLKLNGEVGACLLDLTAGIEGFWNGATQVQDTMRVNLRSSIPPYAQIDEDKVYLSSSGNAVANYTLAPTGNYYIQLIHRNALETWSSSPVNINKTSTTVYDFTGSQAQTFGNNSVLKSGKYCCYSGEIIKDGSIDLSDILAAYNDAAGFVSGYVATDVNGDSFVDLSDITIAFNNAANFVTAITP